MPGRMSPGSRPSRTPRRGLFLAVIGEDAGLRYDGRAWYSLMASSGTWAIPSTIT